MALWVGFHLWFDVHLCGHSLPNQGNDQLLSRGRNQWSRRTHSARLVQVGVRGQFGVIMGPSLGSVIIAIASVTTGYCVDIFSFINSLIFLSRVGKVPILERIESHLWQHFLKDSTMHAVVKICLALTSLISLRCSLRCPPP